MFSLVVLSDPTAVAAPASTPGGGVVAVAAVVAALVVALWRVILRLLLVALVTLALIGVFVVIGTMPGDANALPGAPHPAAWSLDADVGGVA